jgi:glycosyltransferase involved in cell wall biosynthesis
MISVIICTYNRSYRLQQALESLQTMFVPDGLQWELIVVDNNSTDHTSHIVKRFMNESRIHIRFTKEMNQGLAYARNKGINEAKGEIIAFTDDDCIVDPYWLTSIAHEFLSDPSIQGLSGRVELYNLCDKPVSTRTSRKKISITSLDRILMSTIGCNLAISRMTFDTIGLFDVDFGIGTKFAAAEDLDFIYRMFQKGLKIIYAPDVLVYHNHGRRDDRQVIQLNKGYAKGRGAFYCKHILARDKHITKLAFYEYVSLIKFILKKAFRPELSKKQCLVLFYITNGIISKLINKF